MAVNVGDVVFVDYGEVPQCIHSRLVLAEVNAATFEYVILTPDLDLYMEILDASNPDLVAFHVGGPGGGLPRVIRMANIYGFAPMTARDYSNHMRAGRVEAEAERLGVVCFWWIPCQMQVRRMWLLALGMFRPP